MTTELIWRLPKLLEVIGLSRSTIYDMIARGEFPKQVQLGTRAVGWRASQVRAWLDTRSQKEPR